MDWIGALCKKSFLIDIRQYLNMYTAKFLRYKWSQHSKRNSSQEIMNAYLEVGELGVVEVRVDVQRSAHH